MSEMHKSRSLPLGEPIPGGVHSVSVSIPTIADVQRLFRDHDPEAWAALETTYPRFGEHPFVRQALDLRGRDEERPTVAVSSPQGAEALIEYVNSAGREMGNPDYEERHGLTFLSYTPLKRESIDTVKLGLKRVGCVASSRRAEDYLVAEGMLAHQVPEEDYTFADEKSVALSLRRQFYPDDAPTIYLANSGMSAVSAAVETIHELRNHDVKEGELVKDTWIVLGGLYKDSEDYMRSFNDRRVRTINDPTDLTKLRALIESEGSRVAGVLTEAPSNPLLEVADLEQAREIVGDIPLLIDVSTAGSAAVNVMPYADIIIESLTKFASSQGDLMMGAAYVNQASPYADEIDGGMRVRVEQPYGRDVRRLARELIGWRARCQRTGENVMALAEFFESHSAIEKVFWTGSEASQANYGKLARNALLHSGVMTIQLVGDKQPTYDAVDLFAGLSFGTGDTLLTPYPDVVYPLDLTEETAKAVLERRTGLNDRQIRVSVGIEDPDFIIDRFKPALAAN